MYLWLIHVDVWQEPTQYCKAIILQLKNKLIVKSNYEIPKYVQSIINISENSLKTVRFCLWIFRHWPTNIQEALECFLTTLQSPLGNDSLCFGNTAGKMVNSSAFPPSMDKKRAFGCFFTQILSLSNHMKLEASTPCRLGQFQVQS